MQGFGNTRCQREGGKCGWQRRGPFQKVCRTKELLSRLALGIGIPFVLEL